MKFKITLKKIVYLIVIIILGGMASLCAVAEYCKKNDTKNMIIQTISNNSCIIICSILILIILFIVYLYIRKKILIRYKTYKIFYRWWKYIFKYRQHAFVTIHKLMHETRDNLAIGKRFQSEDFLKHFLHVIYDSFLKHISEDFTISLKIQRNEKELLIIRHPETKKTNKRAKINYAYKNELEDNIFINSIFEEGHIMMSEDITKGELFLYECEDYEIKYLKKKKNTISHDILNKCSEYYRSIANFPIKIELDEKARRKLENQEPRRVFGILCLDHPEQFYSSFIGKNCINIFGYIVDFLFLIIFSEQGLEGLKHSDNVDYELSNNHDNKIESEESNEQG